MRYGSAPPARVKLRQHERAQGEVFEFFNSEVRLRGLLKSSNTSPRAASGRALFTGTTSTSGLHKSDPLEEEKNGVGLGLYLVKNLLEALGGHITVRAGLEQARRLGLDPGSSRQASISSPLLVTPRDQFPS
jgi:hypothetical protein